MLKTARTCDFLARCKALLSPPLYREALRIVNDQGEPAARAYLQEYVHAPLSMLLNNITRIAPDAATRRRIAAAHSINRSEAD